MELAKRDIILMELNREIQFRKENIQKKKNEIKKRMVLNEFLSGVASDYQNYNDHIIRQKQQQEESFKMILDYLDRLIKEGNLSEEALEHMKMQNKNILREIDSIISEVDKLIEE